MSASKDEHATYVTFYKSIAGWKAMSVWYNDQEEGLPGFWEPLEVSKIAHKNWKDARREARGWATAEQMPYKEGEIE